MVLAKSCWRIRTEHLGVWPGRTGGRVGSRCSSVMFGNLSLSPRRLKPFGGGGVVVVVAVLVVRHRVRTSGRRRRKCLGFIVWGFEVMGDSSDQHWVP